MEEGGSGKKAGLSDDDDHTEAAVVGADRDTGIIPKPPLL